MYSPIFVYGLLVYGYPSTACEGSMNDNEEYVFLKKLCHMVVQFGVCQLLPLWVS